MFSELEIVDASENTAGVKLDFQALTQDLVLLGTDSIAGNSGAAQSGDHIFGGAGNDTIRGGVGLDYLWGNGGNDTFVYTKVSDSTHNGRKSISWFEFGGWDNIEDWGSEQGNDDTIALLKDLFAGLRGVIKKNGPLDTDTDGDGDFDPCGDMVIILAGNHAASIGPADFIAAG